MKQFINIFIFLFLALCIRAQTQNLNIGGTISGEDDVAMQGVQVNVTKNGTLFTSFPTTYNGQYNLYLPMGAEFVITVSKDGYAKKYFTVSTMGVPAGSEKKKFAVMIADLELIEQIPGVDYSVFNQPINRYYFDSKSDNFEYDKPYLKERIALVEQLKKAKKEAIANAKLKAEQDKKNADLAAEKAKQAELLAAEQASLKKLEEEALAAKKAADEKARLNSVPTIAPVPTTNITSDTNPSILSEPILVLKDNTLITYPRSRMLTRALLLKYKIGVTEEIITGNDMVVIQRILVRNQDAWVYHKKIFNWGGTACFRDQEPITASIFENETKTS